MLVVAPVLLMFCVLLLSTVAREVTSEGAELLKFTAWVLPWALVVAELCDWLLAPPAVVCAKAPADRPSKVRAINVFIFSTPLGSRGGACPSPFLVQQPMVRIAQGALAVAPEIAPPAVPPPLLKPAALPTAKLMTPVEPPVEPDVAEVVVPLTMPLTAPELALKPAVVPEVRVTTARPPPGPAAVAAVLLVVEPAAPPAEPLTGLAPPPA
ncbi:hypothetical protein D3C72_1275310 [compost metagenome]